MKIKAKQLIFLLAFTGMSQFAFAQYRTGHSANVPVTVGPGVTPPSSGSADKIAGELANGVSRDPREESVWRVAQQLGLTSDQRSDLASAFKAAKEERAALDKALQDARRALADSLANGQTFLDSEIENLTSANAKVQESELKLWAKLYAVLTPDQQRRLLSMATPLSVASLSRGPMRAQ